MNISFKFPKAAAAVAGMILMSMSAKAIDFDVEEVVVDGFMYGIVGTEAPYKAYVVEYYDWDEDDYVYKGELVVPETVEFETGKVATVVGVDDDAFSYSAVTMVTLPNTVETIGKKAFGTCSQLTCVKLGSGVTEIMSKAFYPDAKLTTMYIDAVTPPTIAADALPINAETLTLYVPESSVEQYKADETWSKIGNITTDSEVVPVTEIVVSPATANIEVSGTVKLTATVSPAEAQQKVSWTTSDKSVAMVSATGEVFGMKSGMCVITASATDGSGVSGECVVTVGTGTLLQVNMPSISGFTGEVFKLSAEVAPEDATVTWSIGDETIASLIADDKNATVTLLAPGQTTVTVNASNGLSTEIPVTVKENIALTAIEVSPDTIKCEVGDRILMTEFTVKPVPENASAFDPVFSIADTKIVDYDPEDEDMETFECLAPGTTRFVWSQDSIQGYCTIIVAGPDTIVALTGIEVLPDTIKCEVGDRLTLAQFTVKPVPENASVFNPDFSIADTKIVDYDPEDKDMETFECLAAGTTRFVWSQDSIQGYCTIVVAETETDTLITTPAANTYTVITLDGIVLMKNASKTALHALPAGFYIINGKKHLKK